MNKVFLAVFVAICAVTILEVVAHNGKRADKMCKKLNGSARANASCSRFCQSKNHNRNITGACNNGKCLCNASNGNGTTNNTTPPSPSMMELVQLPMMPSQEIETNGKNDGKHSLFKG